MRFEFRKILMQESHDARSRIYVDPDATKFDAATVSLLATEMTVFPTSDGPWTYERLIAECHRTGAWLRSTPGVTGKIPYPGHLVPFVDILLTDRERISAQTRLSAVACAAESNHAMERVAALGETFELVDFLEAKRRRAN